MAAIVPLTFIPPSEPDIANLLIYESADPNGQFLLIDTVPAGIYPNYINRHVTENAASATDWFAIAWQDSEGAQSLLSAPVKGGTRTLIGELVERVLLRSPNLDENIVLQEAEATVSYIYRTTDPYSIDINTVNPLWLTSLAELTMIATLYVTTANLGATSQDYTAGLISERNSVDSRTALDNLERLERRILRRLGIGGSLIASIAEHPYVLPITGVKTTFDSSRVLQVRATLTDAMVVRDLATGDLISPNVD